MPTGNSQLIAPAIGITFIAWTVADMIRGKAFVPHRWWRYYTYFTSDPLDFSIAGGFDLVMGLGICFIFQLPVPKTQTEDYVVSACFLAAWAGLSLFSYLVGSASTRWRASRKNREVDDPFPLNR
jgi:hypothetical protein